MSRIGRNPITIPANVTVTVTGRTVTVVGPLGTLNLALPLKINVEVRDGIVYVTRVSEDKKVKACHGSTRAHIQNMVTGVVTPWKKEMEIRGTGYKFTLQGNKLVVNAGYIHTVDVVAPTGITFTVPDDSKLTITGTDKTVVGQVGSNIRKIRKPEPYKGKGIRYLNEFIKLKAGKTAKA
ncbi:50S ribosomal protein L6 [Candidatus Shapirobacteria bacterium]|nr:50S ribosomal protein L6 [Candidatus Shapirobacteria bacterium]